MLAPHKANHKGSYQVNQKRGALRANHKGSFQVSQKRGALRANGIYVILFLNIAAKVLYEINPVSISSQRNVHQRPKFNEMIPTQRQTYC
jgi:hypothetical protein